MTEQTEPTSFDALLADVPTPDEPAPVAQAAPEAEPDSAAAHVPSKKHDLPPTIAQPAQPGRKYWYVVKVQSGREDSIKAAIERRIKMEGVEEFFGRVLIPTEKYTEVRNGKRVTKHRKKFPGYLMVEVEFNDRIFVVFRETSGVGDFVGATLTRAPTPMSPLEVQRMIGEPDEGDAAGGGKVAAKIKIPYGVGDRVKVRDGTFAGMEGEVKEITEARDAKENPKVKVVLSIWGRPVDVDVEYWQVDNVD